MTADAADVGRPAPTKVYVVETVDYEQSYVQCVAPTLDAAVAALKEMYGPPYVVRRWGKVTKDAGGGAWSLDADFAAVPGYSTEHTAWWGITEHEMAAPPPPPAAETVTPPA